MDQIRSMLASHPALSGDQGAIGDCLEATLSCAAVCSICADACLSEEMVGELRECIRLDMACAAICLTTVSLLTRPGLAGPQPLQAQLAVCFNACGECAAECRRHADMHDHCRICADDCEACQATCEKLMNGMRRAGESEASARGSTEAFTRI